MMTVDSIEMLASVEREFRGARASRVLAKASRVRELSKGVASEIVHVFSSDAAGKFVLAGRQNQHARRARSPESVPAHLNPILN